LHLSLEANALLLEVVGRIPAPANDHGLWGFGEYPLGIAVGIGVTDKALAIAALHAVQRVLDRLAAIAVYQLVLLAVPGQDLWCAERRAARLSTNQYVA
jgi:hypothetical protein